MHAMLLAAGLSTRLGELGRQLPKPLVPVLNRPVASFSIEHLRALGFKELTINSHHLGSLLPAELAPFAQDDLLYQYEPEILGTAGGIRRAALRWSKTGVAQALVVNAKLVFRFDWEALVRQHQDQKAFATLVLRPVPADHRYRTLRIDANARILGIHQPAEGLGEFMFTGVCLLSPEAISTLPQEGCLASDGFVPWIAQGRRVYACIDTNSWHEVSTPAAYLQTNLDLLSGKTRWPSIVPSQAQIAATARIGKGVVLDQCVVGGNTVIEPGVQLSSSVVWPGTVASRDYQGAVLTPSHVCQIH